MPSSLLLLLAAAWSPAAATLYKAPLYDFLSRPDIKAPRLYVDALNTSAVAPGYIFMSPFSPEVPPRGADSINYQFAPMIYDNHGDLIWTGFNETHAMLGTMGFSTCEYEGEKHLCFAHYVLDNPIHNDIVNGSYDVVRSVWPEGQSDGFTLEPDLHEFNVINGSKVPNLRMPNLHGESTAIISSSTVRELEAPFEITKCKTSIKWVKSSVFQEVSLAGDNRVLYQWDSMDHVPIQDAVNCPGHDEVWMSGHEPWSPFDHFHLNAVDKDANGDYYLSARHTSTIYKVSGYDGSIIWQIGKNHTDFNKTSEVHGIEFEFAYQHNLRVQHDYPTMDLANGMIALSLFDNANDDYDYHGRVSDFSAGKILLIDEKARTATLKEAYTLSLDHKHQLSTNQGSFQLLPNGNRIVGGGNIQEVIEWQPGNRQPVFQAHWGDWEVDGHNGHKINSYRSMRFEWEGRPSWKPALFTFAANCGPRMSSYASWNGATEVASWTFWGSATPEGPYQQIGAVNRTGFESRGDTLFANYAYAVALDAETNELGSSDTVAVAVIEENDDRARMQCDAIRCETGFNYTQRATRVCPPADITAELDAMPPALYVQPDHHFGKHCDPCFGPYRRFKA